MDSVDSVSGDAKGLFLRAGAVGFGRKNKFDGARGGLPFLYIHGARDARIKGSTGAGGTQKVKLYRGLGRPRGESQHEKKRQAPNAWQAIDTPCHIGAVIILFSFSSLILSEISSF